MQAKQRDIWDEVWAEYDARQVERGTGRHEAIPRASTAPARPDLSAPSSSPIRKRLRIRPWTQVMLSVAAAAILVAAWFALPWILAARLSVPLGQGDAPALLRQFDTPATLASLRAGLAAQVAEEEGEGARRFLTGMAGRMASSWEKPEGVRAWLALRSRGAWRQDAAPALSAVRSARPVGLTTFRLEYGPAREGGVAFDVAWVGDGFRVTGLSFLDAPDLAAPAARGPVLAMR